MTLAVIAFPLLQQPAYAGGAADGYTEKDEIVARAQQDSTSTTAPVGPYVAPDPGKEVCYYEEIDAETAASAERLAESGWGWPKGPEPGRWAREMCYRNGRNTSGILKWQTETVSPIELAREALQRTPLSSPEIATAPRIDRPQLVGMPTWLWTSTETWSHRTASAAAGDLNVTVNAVPERVVWDMGDGNTVTCTGPGAVYDNSRPDGEQHSDCTYTYRRSSAHQADGTYHVTATIEWHATWVGTGGSGDLGVVRRSSQATVRVAESQAVVTDSR